MHHISTFLSLLYSPVSSGAIYRIDVCTEACAGDIYPNKVVLEDADRRLSVSEEASRAFGRSQTSMYEGFVIIIFVALELVKHYYNKDRYRGIGYDRGQEAEQKQVEIMEERKDKCIVPCYLLQRRVERFKLRSGKVRLADDKTLDIAGIGDVGDVVLKTSFGTSWPLKDIRYIPSLKRRLISVGQLDEKGYHIGFGDQQWKHQRLGDMRRIGMSMLASKGNVPDVRKVDIYFCKLGSLGKQKKLFFIMSVTTRKLQMLEQVHTEGYGPTFITLI
nr:retrovirus-related Pol polyprotein from transposon TNT 1-94 [Tanacetum cinerariifolium]